MLAYSQCELDFARLGNTADFWAGKGPVLVANDQPLTFSFDSEATWGDILHFLQSEPKGLERLEALLKSARSNEANSFFVGGNLEEIAAALGISVNQVKSFALKKGVDREKAFFYLTDFHPSYFSKLVQRPELKPGTWAVIQNPEFFTEVSALVREGLERRGLPFALHRDVDNLEFTHQSWTDTPSDFQNTIRKLHAQLKQPQTHLHIGIPAAVSDRQVHSIARAVESRIILRLARDSADEVPLPFHKGTTLNGYDLPAAGTRGVIRLGVREWTKPVPAHNLEIRQWFTVQQGMNDLALAGKLAQNHQRVKVLDFRSDTVSDPFTNNLPGALKYVGTLLRESTDSERRKLAEKFLEFSGRMEREKKITRELRREVHEFLQRIDIDELLDESLFLNER